MANVIWENVVAFLESFGSKIMGIIAAAIPPLEQVALDAFSVLLNAAIAYVEAKYLTPPTVLKATAPLSAADKLVLDNQKHNDAFNYIKAEVAKNPSSYPVISDSLLHFGIEVYVQKAKRDAEGNHGVFPGGNSGPVPE